MVEVSDAIWQAVRTSRFEITDEGVRFIIKGGSLSTEKFLTRKLKLQEKYKDNEIRDIGSKIDVTLNPPGLITCSTPEDYVKMYQCQCSSCMIVPEKYTIASILHPIDREIFERYGLWSSIWAHYCPDFYGVFITDKNGNPTARSFVTYDGRFFGLNGNSSSNTKLSQLLMSRGLVNSGIGNECRDLPKTTFSMPAIETSKGPAFPYPSFNILYERFLSMKYNESTNEVIFDPLVPKEGFIAITKLTFGPQFRLISNPQQTT